MKANQSVRLITIATVIAVTMAGCANMPQLPQLPQLTRPGATSSTQSITFGNGRGYSPTVSVVVPAGTCDAHWFIEGYKGKYPYAWNLAIAGRPALRARAIVQPPIPPDESRAQLSGPGFDPSVPVNTSSCLDSSWSAGTVAAQHDVDQAIYDLSTRTNAH